MRKEYRQCIMYHAVGKLRHSSNRGLRRIRQVRKPKNHETLVNPPAQRRLPRAQRQPLNDSWNLSVRYLVTL